jgi:hypothetical protein
VCPTGAIIFPKYPDGPINGGKNTSGQPVRLDPSQLIDDDVMEKLRQRSGNNPGAQAILQELEKKGNSRDSGQDCQC